MTQTKFGCSYSDFWVSPSDWESTKKKNLNAEWYVQCYFYDPAFIDKYPNGFQFRKKANRPKTLEEKQKMIRHLLKRMPELLDAGYSPITRQIMGKEISNEDLNKKTPLIEALEYVFNKRIDNKTKTDIKSVLKYVTIAIKHLHLDTLRISKVKRKHIKFCLEYLQENALIERQGVKNKKTGSCKVTYYKLTDKRYNKYISYMQMLFEDIREFEVLKENPCHGIKKKTVIVEARKTLTKEQRIEINDFLKENYPTFWRFSQIFFHSGSRINELLSVKVKDVDLSTQTFKVLIKKSGAKNEHRIVQKVIKNIALQYWKDLIKDADPEAYIFHRGLVPGVSEKPIRSDQISRRWREHIKNKLGINKDFYPLKHLNLDEVTELLSIQDAAIMASHTTTKMVENIYAVGEKERQMERLKNISNEF